MDISLNPVSEIGATLESGVDLDISLFPMSEMLDYELDHVEEFETNLSSSDNLEIDLEGGTIIQGSKVIVNPQDPPTDTMETIKVDGTTYDLPTITVDDEMSDISTNPVQNKVIKSYTDEALTQLYRDVAKILTGTQAQWDSDPQRISEKNVIYIYTDHEIIDDKPIPAMKIGDGRTYLIDMEFITDYAAELLEHINNGDIHVTLEEKRFWNNKVTCDESMLVVDSKLILTKQEVL